MLVLTRRKGQKVLFPGLGISVEVVEVSGKTARVAIDAPKEIRILRDELEPDICDENEGAIQSESASESVSESVSPVVQQELDTVNLAIRLAGNQLRFGATAHAQRALQKALQSLADLDATLRSELKELKAAQTDNGIPEPISNLVPKVVAKSVGTPSSFVKEANAGYRVSAKYDVSNSDLVRTPC